jgi:hypothetical protein
MRRASVSRCTHDLQETARLSIGSASARIAATMANGVKASAYAGPSARFLRAWHHLGDDRQMIGGAPA